MKLFKITKPYRLKDYKFTLVILVLALSFLGVLVIGSANEAYQGRQLIGLAGAVVLMIAVSLIDYVWIANFYWILYILSVGMLALVLVPGIGEVVNGARRWINLGFTNFQPSELAKIVTIVISSSYLGKCLDKKLPITVDPRKNIIFLICIAIAGLVELQPDMGTAMIILGIPTMLYFIAGLDKKWIGIICGLGAIVLAFLATFQPYRLDRIRSWFDPWSRSQDDGYQIVQSILAIGSGEFSGMGLGHGFSKYSYLPESHTDFAFAVFCQEMGFIGALVIFLLLIAMAFYFIKIALRTQDNFGKMLVCGIMLLIVGQAAGNIAMVIGLLPVIGFPLPFISYGGTSLILNMTCMGLVISVDRHNRKSASAPPVSSRTGRYSKNR